MIAVMPDDTQNQLRLALLNCENLFVFMDLWSGEDVQQMNEKEWQRLSAGTVPNKSLRKLKWLAQTFEEMNPDIILLNEVGGIDSLANFARHFLRDQYNCHLIEGNSDRGIDIGYLTRKTLPFKFDLISHRRRPINFLYPHEVGSNLKSHYFSRDALELRVFPGGAQRPGIVFLLVHLKSPLDPQGFDPGGKARRAAELRTLVEIYNEVRRELPGTPVVVAGDFNGVAGKSAMEPEFQPIYDETDLVETFDLIAKPLTETATRVNFKAGAPPRLIKIDHVFLSPELHDKVAADQSEIFLYRSDLKVKMPYAATVEQRTALPSDHYPILVVLTCPCLF